MGSSACLSQLLPHTFLGPESRTGCTVHSLEMYSGSIFTCSHARKQVKVHLHNKYNLDWDFKEEKLRLPYKLDCFTMYNDSLPISD